MVSPVYLLDTNVLSEPLKPRPNAKVLKQLERHEGLLATASVVWHELLYSAFRLPETDVRRAIEKYLHEVIAATIPILPYDERAAAWHATERARLEKAGRTRPFVDGQIAAVAKLNGLVLVTRNESDFAEFEGLEIEDWHR